MKTTTKVHTVLPAAGRGVRFGKPTNKIFQELRGKPIISWTVDAFRSTTDLVTIVAGPDDIDRLKKMFVHEDVRITLGGQSRQESVWNGLQTVEGDDTIVLVHDAARPLISTTVIQRCIDSARVNGSGVAAVPVYDSLKLAENASLPLPTVIRDIDRDGVWATQTPQAFRLGLLRQAHLNARADGFLGLDEAALFQRLPKEDVFLVQGDRRNVKITTEDDLAFAELLTNDGNAGETRTGIGYDIHRLVCGRPLWLGGIQIESLMGLDGHSDADVLLHSICDSLLGAAGLPDIGHQFPNTDKQFKNISSITLLKSVAQLLAEAGWSVVNIDSMLIAESPKIAPFIDLMKAAISGAISVSKDRLSIKATTNEGIGSLGSGEGIACYATSTIFRRH